MSHDRLLKEPPMLLVTRCYVRGHVPAHGVSYGCLWGQSQLSFQHQKMYCQKPGQV